MLLLQDVFPIEQTLGPELLLVLNTDARDVTEGILEYGQLVHYTMGNLGPLHRIVLITRVTCGIMHF